MPDEIDRGTYELRRMLGTMVGEAYRELVERIESGDEIITVAEWKILIGQWMQRPETTSGFQSLVDRCRVNRVNPGDSQLFKNEFVKYVSSDIKVLFLDKLRDSVAYLSFLIAGRKPAIIQRVNALENLGLK